MTRNLNGLEREKYQMKKLGCNDFEIHHLLPKSLFPKEKWIRSNMVPLSHDVHSTLHKQYSTFELIMDPLTPIIEITESQLKHYNYLEDVAVYKNASK